MSHFNKPEELMELQLSIKPLALGNLLAQAGCVLDSTEEGKV